MLAACIVLGLQSAVAQSDDVDPTDRALAVCLDTPENMNTAGMIICHRTAMEAWDARLNRAYTSVMAGLNPDAKGRLRDAQRRWIVYRDAMIAVYASPFWDGHGSMARLGNNIAITNLVRQQTLLLEGMRDTISPGN